MCRLPHLRPQPLLRLLAPANDSTTTGWTRRDPLNPGSPGPPPAASRHRRQETFESAPFSSCVGFQPTQSFCHQGMAHPKSILTALPRPSGGPTSHGQRAHSARSALHSFSVESPPKDLLQSAQGPSEPSMGLVAIKERSRLVESEACLR